MTAESHSGSVASALSRPHVGASIWLAAGVASEPAAELHPGVVVESSTDTFVYRFRGPAAPPPHSSGAPLLDAEGNVVAINAGIGFLDGHYFGHGSHVDSIRRHLSSIGVSV